MLRVFFHSLIYNYLLEFCTKKKHPQNASITKEGQVGHVLGTVKLGGVDLADGVRLEDLVLSVDIDGKLLASGEGVILDLLLRDALEVATDVLVCVGDPH